MSGYHDVDKMGMQVSLAEALKGYEAGGIPIGSAVILFSNDNVDGQEAKLLGSDHNQRVQKSSPTLHGEISALEAAGRLKPEMYRNSIIYTTLSPCSMCAGAILLYKIPRVVIGENVNFQGEEELLKSRGVEVVVLNDKDCIALMKQFIKEKPELWFEDIGEHEIWQSDK